MNDNDIKWQETPKENEEPKNEASIDAEALADLAIKNHQNNNKKNPLQTGLIIGFVVALVVMIIALVVVNTIKTEPAVENTETESESEPEIVENEQIVSEEISASTVTVTIDGKPITYKAAYLIDGKDVIIYSGTFESTTDDEVTFLVINGGKLRIEAGTEVKKTGSENQQENSTYGTNSAIVAIGENSSVEIIGADIITDAPDSNAVVAINGAKVVAESTIIKTIKDNFCGLKTLYQGTIDTDDVAIGEIDSEDFIPIKDCQSASNDK